ncbi:MAG: putative Ig domain-containing protein, partial [Limisphaerales bacterium]
FTMMDAETPAADLILAASSSNQVLLPNANIILSGTDTNRSILLIPGADLFGQTLVSLIVSDGVLSATNQFLLTVTPVNDPPILAPISNRTIDELSLLLITNLATDVDTPAHLLTFSLSTNAPAGAKISTSGVFSWVPAEEQGPGTYHITVVVSDNENPSLSDAREFQVVVNEVNAAPSLAPIANRTVHAGTTVIVMNKASDPDFPANLLNFSLLTQLPGATVDPLTGLFAWTPTEGDVGSSNTIGIQVQDDGSPVLSSSVAFNVVVVSRPLQTISLEDSAVRILWDAISGESYRVEVTTNLADQVWMNLTEITATGSVAEFHDPIGNDEKFYRIRIP